MAVQGFHLVIYASIQFIELDGFRAEWEEPDLVGWWTIVLLDPDTNADRRKHATNWGRAIWMWEYIDHRELVEEAGTERKPRELRFDQVYLLRLVRRHRP